MSQAKFHSPGHTGSLTVTSYGMQTSPSPSASPRGVATVGLVTRTGGAVVNGYGGGGGGGATGASASGGSVSRSKVDLSALYEQCKWIADVFVRHLFSPSPSLPLPSSLPLLPLSPPSLLPPLCICSVADTLFSSGSQKCPHPKTAAMNVSMCLNTCIQLA